MSNVANMSAEEQRHERLKQKFNSWRAWANQLPDLPNDDHARITQIAQELAHGIVLCHWYSFSFKYGLHRRFTSNYSPERKEMGGLVLAHLAWRLSGDMPSMNNYVKGNFTSWFIDDPGGRSKDLSLENLREVLLLAGYLENVGDRSNELLRLTSKAFDLLRTEPTELEELSRKQLKVERRLLLAIVAQAVVAAVAAVFAAVAALPQIERIISFFGSQQ